MGFHPLAMFVLASQMILLYAHVGYHPPPDDDRNRGNDRKARNHESRSTVDHNSAAHVILCNEYNVTASWNKFRFIGDEYDVKLLDNTCNDFCQNKTTVWITADFGTCGSTIIEHRNVIVQKNSAFFTVRNITGSIAREYIYKYNLQCLFQRKNNASTGYKVVQGIKKTVELAAESSFDITIDVYTSPSYLIKEVHPITVSMNQPIHVGIKKINDNKHFKMIVEQCFATPTANPNGAAYVFYNNKCPQDASFRILGSNDNKFNFVINTFRFVKTSKSIYIHCRVFICQAISKSPQCQQTCSRRNRRVTRGIKRHVQNKIFENVEIKEIQNVTTTRIVFVEKKSCADLSCPKNSKCFDLYPAVCRCDDGFVLSSTHGLCINQRILKLKGLHLKTRWVYTYANISSFDFMRLAVNIEKKLRNVFLRLQLSHIDGIKMVGAKESNGVAADVILTHKESTTVENTSNALIDIFTNKASDVLSVFHQTNIRSNPIPILEIYSTGAVVKRIGLVSTTAPSKVERKVTVAKKDVVARIQTTAAPTLKNKPITNLPAATAVKTMKTVIRRVTVVTTSIPVAEVKTAIIQKTQKAKVITDAPKKTNALPKTTYLTKIIPCLLNTTVIHQTIKVEPTPCLDGSNAKVIHSNKKVLLLSIVLSLSFVVILIITALVCHYKRNIYYHVLTW